MSRLFELAYELSDLIQKQKSYNLRLGNTKKSGTEPLNKGGGKLAGKNAVVDRVSTTESDSNMTPKQVVSQPKFKGVIKAIFLIINMALMMMMSATGVLGIKNSSSVTDVSAVIVGLYMILFAAMLAIFELIQIYPCSTIDFLYKKNFGFLYGMMGKSGFTIFMAVLSFGITNPQQLAVATGNHASIVYN